MDKQVFSNEELVDLARWLKVISEPNRLLLLEKIIEGVQCNCELGEALQMAPNLISHHLSVLREAGLIETERDPVDARWIYYSINQKTFEQLCLIFHDFFGSNRIQTRKSTCGPHTIEDQMISLLKMKD